MALAIDTIDGQGLRRSVQTFKMGLKWITEGSLKARLNKFLFQYRLTPQTTTGLSPAELMFGRRLRSHLDLLMPSIATRVNAKQQQLGDTLSLLPISGVEFTSLDYYRRFWTVLTPQILQNGFIFTFSRMVLYSHSPGFVGATRLRITL